MSAVTPYPYTDFDIDGGIPIGVGALARVLRVEYRPEQHAPPLEQREKARGGTEEPEVDPRSETEHGAKAVFVACKVLSKLQLLQMKKVEAVMKEKAALMALGPHPLIARLYGTHQSHDELFFFMEELPRGDLQEHITRIVTERRKKNGMATATTAQHNPEDEGESGASYSANTTSTSPFIPGLFCLPFADLRLILAQIILALEHCHTNNTPKYTPPSARRKGNKIVTSKGEGRASCRSAEEQGKEGTNATFKPHHSSRYVLRDLKSENVCFDSHGRCVLIDFDCVDECVGLVPTSNYGDALGEAQRANESDAAKEALRRRTISEIQESRRMSAYNFCGTVQFVSPEVLGQLKWSYASDLWALGVIAYQLLFGRYPFIGDMPFLTMKEIIKGLQGEKHFPPTWSKEAEGAIILDEPAACSSSMSAGAEKEKKSTEDGARGSSTNTLNASPSICHSSLSHSPRYSLEQYALTRDFIESLLMIDPTKRLGVSRKDLEPCYDDLFNHPLFTMPTVDYTDATHDERSNKKDNTAIPQPRKQQGEGGDLSSAAKEIHARVLPALDWVQLRKRLGLFVPKERGGGGGEKGDSEEEEEEEADEDGSYVYVPLSEQYEQQQQQQIITGGGHSQGAQHSELRGDGSLDVNTDELKKHSPSSSSVLDLYVIKPYHDESYSSHADDICSAAGPLESFLINGSPQPEDNMDPPKGSSCSSSSSGGQEDDGAAVGRASSSRNTKKEISPRLENSAYRTVSHDDNVVDDDDGKGERSSSSMSCWLTQIWGEAYFANLSNFHKFAREEEEVHTAGTLKEGSTSDGVLRRVQIERRVAAANTKNLLLARPVVEAVVARHGVGLLSTLKAHWETCHTTLKMLEASFVEEEEEGKTSASASTSTGGSTIPISVSSSSSFLRVTRKKAFCLELKATDSAIYKLLESVATELANEAAAKNTEATAAYLKAVERANAERRKGGLAVDLGVNNPYAPYASTPMVISDLKREIEEAEEEALLNRRGGDDETDDVIDDVGVDKQRRLSKPDADFSK